ncbi:MAG: hypothetical protein LIO62_04870, partial [Clostridiales bacterium]|nr:hypothetical protein [Clostridiales bacterium]
MNFDANKYVELYDYKSIELENDYVQISQDELESIVNMELSSYNEFIEVTDRTRVKTDDILLLEINCEEEYYLVSSNAYSEDFDNELVKKSVNNTFEYNIEGENS